ncbi:MAG: hypothetical protein ISN29_00240 [Gammaproteobacteria bacterium AqS3]|nr:hypothetical protein [Gammaproteobacteria bacterium AqS3]
MSKDREIWLRLSEMKASGIDLSEESRRKLEELSRRYSKGSKNDESHSVKVQKLIVWLNKHSVTNTHAREDWRKKCRDDFDATADALCELADKDNWRLMFWHEAFQSWPEEEVIHKSWGKMAVLLAGIPDDKLPDIAEEISRWLWLMAKSFEKDETHFFSLVKRILAIEHKILIHSEDPVFCAINHPVGDVTEALFRWWYRWPPKEGQKLPSELEPVFTKLCDLQIQQYRHGRVILANYADALFTVDKEWTDLYLLPLFDWDRFPDEAASIWRGFLLNPYVYPPLMEAIKHNVLDTVNHYQALGTHGRQYADFITVTALNPDGNFLNSELAEATRLLPPDGLQKVTQTLVRTLRDAGDQRADYWLNRIAPYLKAIWPENPGNLTPDEHADISEGLGRLCVAAHENFPEALNLLRDWLVPITADVPSDQIYELHKSELCGIKPAETLDFLALIIDAKVPQISKGHLKDCLEMIVRVQPQFEDDSRYKRLIKLTS